MLGRQMLACVSAVSMAAISPAPVFAQYTLVWYRIAGGGENNMSGGPYSLSGTIGQHDAGKLSGGVYAVSGGFWSGALPDLDVLGDLNCDGAANVLDINPFVLAILDPVAYAATYPGCNRLNADINGDGAANVLDINPFVALLLGG